MTECARPVCDAPTTSTKYCSTRCSNKDRAAPDVEGAKNPNYDGGKQKYTCPDCGNTVYRWPSTVRGERAFCDKECLGSWKSENLSGMNHPLWDGSSGLMNVLREELCSTSWVAKSRDIRDGSVCRMCGTKEALDVHHIVPLLYGGTGHNENLMVFCKSCHRKVEKYTKSIINDDKRIY